MAPVFYGKLAFVTFFNAGVRAIDIRNPYQPKEVGYFIPAITEATDKRCVKVDGKERCKIAIQSNNVETDDRGYIYVVDRANTGLHILELTGEARAIAGSGGPSWPRLRGYPRLALQESGDAPEGRAWPNGWLAHAAPPALRASTARAPPVVVYSRRQTAALRPRVLRRRAARV